MNTNNRYHIKDHIRLSKELCTGGADSSILRPKLLDLFATIFSRQESYHASLYQARFLPIQKELSRLDYIIGLSPNAPSSSAALSNTITIDFYPLISLSNIPMFKPIIDAITCHHAVSLDDLKTSLEKNRHTDFGVYELNALFSLWDTHSVDFSKDRLLCNWNENFIYIYHALELLFHREMSRWHLNHFIKQAKDDYISHIVAELDHALSSKCEAASIDRAVRLQWAEELTVDIMAIRAVYSKAQKASEREAVFFSVGLYYSLLKAEELYRQKATAVSVYDLPVLLRESVVRSCLAKFNNLSIEEFHATAGGAWFLTSSYFDLAVLNYELRESEGISS